MKNNSKAQQSRAHDARGWKETSCDLVILESCMNIGLLLAFFVFVCMLGVLAEFLFRMSILFLAFCVFVKVLENNNMYNY